MAALVKKKLIRRGSRIRVLVVDDSVVIRRLVTHALEGDPALEIVGTAANGSIGLARIPQLNPDVITLDIEMPQMNGLEMLKHVRQQYKDVRIIMFSTLTDRGAAATMEALSLGADDYVTKASNIGSLDRSMAALRDELIPKIKQFFTMEDGAGRVTLSPARPVTPVRPAPVLRSAPRVVVIGVSTGGPTALGEIIPTIPHDFPLPILIVQHMPPVFTRLLAERLQASTKLKVEEAVNGAIVDRGKIFIAPGNFHMRVQAQGTTVQIALDQNPPENSCRPAADVLFRSASDVYGGATLAVVLTGMGCDGLRGAEVLRGNGAQIIAQDEASSVVWGMPGAIAGAGLADAVVSLDCVVPEILRRTGKR